MKSKIQPPPIMPQVQAFAKRTLLIFLAIGFWLIELFLIGVVFANVGEVIRLQAARILPTPSNPVARFITKINWEKRTIEFDGSASKTFNNKVAKRIWRIDDGTSSMEGDHFTHTFTNPGYYQILFSVVDTNGQSDQADCRFLFPPENVEQVIVSETNDAQDVAKTVARYMWVPKGIFFNYSKLSAKSVGDLRSPFVETGCGFSNTAYNSYDEYENVSQRVRILRNSLAGATMGVLAMPLTFAFYRFLKKKLEAMPIATG